tara:strand:- start:342 stop:443 length:102 start_codon:yes stop_codon:yes gene_type:complete
MIELQGIKRTVSVFKKIGNYFVFSVFFEAKEEL